MFGHTADRCNSLSTVNREIYVTMATRQSEVGETEVLTALGLRLHQLEDFPKPLHPFPFLLHLGNITTR